MKNIRRLICLAACVVGSNTAQAIVTNWTIQSASSTLILTPTGLTSGSESLPLFVSPQPGGGYSTTYSGTVTTEQAVTAGVPTSVQILSGQATANNGGNYIPLPSGESGSAPANYGLSFGDFIPVLWGALRDIEIDFTSDVMTVGSFPPEFPPFEGLLTANLSGNAIIGPIPGGTAPIPFAATETFIDEGSFLYSPTVTKLFIPVSFNFGLIGLGAETPTTDDDFTFHLNLAGYFTATAPTESVPEANSLALLGLAGSAIGFMGYRRKRRYQGTVN